MDEAEKGRYILGIITIKATFKNFLHYKNFYTISFRKLNIKIKRSIYICS